MNRIFDTVPVLMDESTFNRALWMFLDVPFSSAKFGQKRTHPHVNLLVFQVKLNGDNV